MAEDRFAFGLHIRSDLALPELAAANHDTDRPRIVVGIGKVADNIPGAIRVGSMGLATPRDFLLDVPGVARYRVYDGKEIIVDPAADASMPDVRSYLFGIAFGVLCYQRGLQPLHANAVEVDGRCIAVAGPPGSGKSTLAAYLSGRSYRALGDDLCVLSFEPDGDVLVWSGPRRFKLWKDSLLKLGYDMAGLERAISGREKYNVPHHNNDSSLPLPFHRLYVLAQAPEGADGSIHRLTGRRAFDALVSNAYRPDLAAALGKRPHIYVNAIAVLKRAMIYSFERRWGFTSFAHEVDALERHFRAG